MTTFYVTDCYDLQIEGYRPKIYPFIYEVQYPLEQLIPFLTVYEKAVKPHTVLGSPFIDYDEERDLITITIYNNYQE